jgi:hypothetical protein
MLRILKQWFSGKPATPEGSARHVIAWAQGRQLEARPVRDEDAVVVEGQGGGAAWRLEWGPAQRSYVKGQELRLRADVGGATDLQMVVINRVLQESMERAVFDQYVEGVQTRIDDQTPPEMRWLVMYPKLGGPELGRLKDRFAAVGNSKSWLSKWVSGPLGDALMSQTLPVETPLVLMVARGRLMLRAQFNEPTSEALDAWVALFETALAEAREVAEQVNAPLAPSTQPSMFTSSELPIEETQN